MLKLSDFFGPLNLVNLLYFLLLLIFFDVSGSLVKSFFIKKDEVESESRLVNWLIGLGLFIFIWFVLGFFIVPTQLNILISIVTLFCVSLPFYLKNKKFLSLFKVIKPLLLPIILVIPFLPSTFVKASLPPYVWDEMAYHFVSPYSVLHTINQYWQFTGGLYGNLPRLMDTLYILSFSLTHTYSVVRLVQFSVLITSIFSAFLLVKKVLGKVSAFLFILIFLSLPLAIPSLATIGYVDIAALSFLLLGIAFGIIFLFSKTPDHLVLSLIFWAMSIGTKYTTLTAFGAFIISFTIVYWIKNKSFTTLFDRKKFLKIFLGLVIFGGYWYIKNFIVYGNPIYPFLFPCWGKFAQDCVRGSSFFGTWTMSVNIYSFYPIIAVILSQNPILRLVLILSPFLIVIFGDRKSKLILLMLGLSFGIELLVLKFFSGFDSRYQQYLLVTLIFIVILTFLTKFKPFIPRLIQLTIFGVLVSSCVFCYFRNIIYLNSSKFISQNEVNYALGKENISDWVKDILPDVSAATLWCSNPPGGPIALADYDPDMIWYKYSGLMRVYLTGCYYQNPDIQPGEWKDIVPIAQERKLKFWTISINPCVSQDRLVPGLEKTKSDANFLMREVNNAIVCNSTEVVQNLYYFDYEKLK